MPNLPFSLAPKFRARRARQYRYAVVIDSRTIGTPWDSKVDACDAARHIARKHPHWPTAEIVRVPVL